MTTQLQFIIIIIIIIIRKFSLYTQQWYMSYRFADSLRAVPSCSCRKLSANLYDIYRCCVYSEKLLMMDTGTVRNLQFYSKNKFEKLVHLVGYIIRIYHDARSPERQILRPIVAGECQDGILKQATIPAWLPTVQRHRVSIKSLFYCTTQYFLATNTGFIIQRQRSSYIRPWRHSWEGGVALLFL